MNNKVCVLFNSHLVDDETIKRFRHIQAGCNIVGYDIKWVIDITNGEDAVVKIPADIDVFKFSESNLDAWMKLSGQKPTYYRYNYPILSFFKLFPQYDYMWNIEYDVCFSGNWDTFFTLPFNDFKFDMIASFISSSPPVHWCWWGFFDGNKTYPFWRNCLHMLARFSKKAMESANKFFVEFNMNGKLHSEMGYVSACIRDNLNVCGLENYNVLCPGFYVDPMRPVDIRENMVWHAIKNDYIWPYCK